MKAPSREEVVLSWNRFLDPVELRRNLLAAAIFIAGYEMLRDVVVERVRAFLSDTYDVERASWIESDLYRGEILREKNKRLLGSILWLLRSGAIDDGDAQLFNELTEKRNGIVHEMEEFVTNRDRTEYADLFRRLVVLLQKVETWWTVNLDIPSNPDFDGVEVRADEISHGSVVMLQWMAEVAFGSGEISDFELNRATRKLEK